MPEDLRKPLHKGIEEMRADILRLAALVSESTTAATAALLEHDMEVAQALIDHDDVLDDITNRLEEMCDRLLVLQAPMAVDLRMITGSLRIANDLERAGDLVVNIMKGARRMYGVDVPVRLRGVFEQMGEEAARLIRLASDAYADKNGALGAALHDIDNRLDDLQKELIAVMFEVHSDGGLDLPTAIQLALIARYFERIGDHAVNIGERVAYITTGQFPAHGHHPSTTVPPSAEVQAAVNAAAATSSAPEERS